MSNTIKTIIADDHKMFRQGLTSIVSSFGNVEIVAEAENGKVALQLLEEHSAQLVITDIAMPEMDGVEFCKQAKKNNKNLKVIALTMHTEKPAIAKMMKSGADGYLLKDTGKEELEKAIKKVMAGDKYITPVLNELLLKSMITGEESNTRSAYSKPELSERELEVLELIAEGLTMQEIADKIFVSQHTAIFHRRNLLEKLNAKNSAELIKLAMDFGLIQ